MSQTTIVQVPIDKSFRDEVTFLAKNMGFSSLQELIRFTLVQIKNQTIVPSLINTSINLSSKAIIRYDKMINDVKSGKITPKSFNNTNNALKYLNN